MSDRFVDVAAAAGLDFVHNLGARGGRHLAETVTGGAAWLDSDGDGDLDLYLVGGNEHSDTGAPSEARSGASSCRLYRNDAGRFTDVTAESGTAYRGYGIGAAAGDYDNDGKSDLYVTGFALPGSSGNALYHNDGGRFSDATAAAGVAGAGWSTAAGFFDADSDGLLDLYVVRYVRYDPAKRCERGALRAHCSPTDFPGEPDLLFRNRGNGSFEDVSARSGIAFEDPAGGAGLGILSIDFDIDGDTDLFVANDQGPNYLFRNDGGKFTDVALAAGVAYGPDGNARAGMGVDAGDVNLDGREDVVVTNFADEPDGLFLAIEGGMFRDAAAELGVAAPTLVPLGFGTVLFDHDLDGDLDLYIAEGHVHDNIEELRPGSGHRYAQPDLLLENLDGRGFRDISLSAGAWFREARVGRAAACADYDEDGDEDLVVVSSGGRAALLENRLPRGAGWIALRLRGTRANRDAYGARVAVVMEGEDGVEQTRFFEVRSARSYAAACDPRVRVGLGPRPPRSIRAIVRWPGPSRAIEEYRGIQPGRTTDIVEASGAAAAELPRPAARRGAPPSSPPSSTARGPGPAPALAAASPERPPAPDLNQRLERARMLRARHRLTEALAELDAAAAESSVTVEAKLLRAQLLFSLSRAAEATAVLEPLDREGTGGSAARVLLAAAWCDLGRHADAAALFGRLASEGVAIPGEPRRAFARALLETGRPAEALSQIVIALAADPWLEAGYLDYGQALVRVGRPERAAPYLARYRAGERMRRREQRALDLENQGRAAEGQYELGQMELERGRLFAAMGHLNRARALDSRHGLAFLDLARLSARLERQDDALKHLPEGSQEEAVKRARAEIEATIAEDGALGEARREIRIRMAGRSLGECSAEMIELSRLLAGGGEPARAREVALFAAELAARDPRAQLAAAEAHDAPGEEFIRLWALERALRLSPADGALAARRNALRASLEAAK